VRLQHGYLVCVIIKKVTSLGTIWSGAMNVDTSQNTRVRRRFPNRKPNEYFPFETINLEVYYLGRHLGNVFRIEEWEKEDRELYERECAGI